MRLNQQLKDQYGFIVLLASLIFLLILPSFWQEQNKQVITAVLLIVMTLAFLSLVAQKRLEMIIGCILALPVLYLNLHNIISSNAQPNAAMYALNILFYVFIVVELLRHIVRQQEVNFNIIAAAVIVYLIIGLLWSFIYLIIEIQSPGAILGESKITAESIFATLLYFSFVTMTTLGYGDISPHTELAGKWVVLEAIIGQFYLTILVARLVSLYGVKKGTGQI